MEWQELSTPPKRGVRVLVFVPPYGAMSGHRSTQNGAWHCHSCLNKEAQPTHWMPLPEPPQ